MTICPDLRQPFAFDAAILADGDFPTHALPLSLLSRAPFVVCCDGAIRHYPQADALVGDGDSVPAGLRSRLHLVSEQEDNDLTKATRFCLSRGFKTIVYLGATGRREDHTLGNIALLVRYMQDFGLCPVMATDHGWFVPAEGPADFASFPGQQVSIFNFGCRHIAATGLVYPCYAYQSWWQGTLNESTADLFHIEADGAYLVYRTYLSK